MTWLPWLAILVRRSAVVALMVGMGTEHEWRLCLADFRAHWKVRPWA